MIKLKIKHLLFIAIFFSFLAAYFFPGIGDDTRVQSSITFIGILFGILVGFFIADLYARYQGIRENAAIDSSCLSTFYYMATILGQKNKKWLGNVETRINKYIKKFMPLPWEEYSKTEKEFGAIGDSLRELKYTTNKENETYANILAVYSQHSDAREKLVMYGKDKLSWGEWLVSLFLGILLLASLFYVKDTSLVSTIFTGGNGRDATLFVRVCILNFPRRAFQYVSTDGVALPKTTTALSHEARMIATSRAW